jgi:hypothetical protein
LDPLKVGIPLAADIPAPVKNMIFFLSFKIYTNSFALILLGFQSGSAILNKTLFYTFFSALSIAFENPY